MPLAPLQSSHSSPRDSTSAGRRAFTMVELMVTMTIAAVLIVAALFFYVIVIPWAQQTFNNYELTCLVS